MRGAKLILANQIERFQIKYLSRTKWWNSLYFFTSWYQKLRVERKILGWVWWVWQTDHKVMDEWMDELSWFFAYWCKFRKVKNYFNNFWVVVVKNVHGTLISKCMNEPGWFFARYTYLRELKVTLLVTRWVWWNMGCPFKSWDSIICCIPRVN